MADVFDPGGIRAYYDALGEGEWGRLSAEPVDEVKFHVHAHYLRAHIPSGPTFSTSALAQAGSRSSSPVWALA